MKFIVTLVAFLLLDLACYYAVDKSYRLEHLYGLIPGGGFVLLYQFNHDRNAGRQQ